MADRKSEPPAKSDTSNVDIFTPAGGKTRASSSIASADKAAVSSKVMRPKSSRISNDSSLLKTDQVKPVSSLSGSHASHTSKSKSSTQSQISKGKSPVSASSLHTPDTVLDDRLNRLEAIILAQNDENNNFKELIMNSLSLEHNVPHSLGVDPQLNYVEDDMDIPMDYDEDYFPPEQPGRVDSENLDYSIVSEHHALPDLRQSETVDVSNPGPNKLARCDAVGFAAKYATESSGPELDSFVSDSLKYLMNNQLLEKNLNDMMDKYNTPSNCSFLRVPKVNSPIWDSIQSRTRSLDLKMQRVQKCLVKGTTAIAQDMVEPSNSQQDALTCFASANFELNMLRRELIKPDLNPKFAPLCKPSVPVTENLFGNDLSKNIKDLSEVQRATGRMTRGRGQFRPRNFVYGGQRGRAYGRNRFLGYSQQYSGKAPGTQRRPTAPYQYQYQPTRKMRGRGAPKD